MHLQKISVLYDYPICFTESVFDPENLALVECVSRREPLRRHRLAVVVDEQVARAHPALLDALTVYVERFASQMELAAAPWTISGGEGVKNDPGAVDRVSRWMHEVRLDRHACLLAIGGGAVLDLVGFACAITHRGVRLVRLPTTVLAQADSGVSVKNGVNAFGKKNYLGTFAPPFAVLNDRCFLQTLASRDRRAGMAEAVKVALVRDAGFFRWMQAHAVELAEGEPGPLWRLIQTTAQLHLDHIAGGGDPFEQGNGRPLDFGHWAGHKLESLSGYQLRHGEAVALGLALECLYAEEVGALPHDTAAVVLALLRQLGLPLWDPALELMTGGRPTVFEGLEEFREHLGGALTLTLLTDLGRPVDVHVVRVEALQRAHERLSVLAR